MSDDTATGRDLLMQATSGTGFDNTALGVVIDEASGDLLRAHLEITPRHHQPFGITHGGVYCAVAEGAASSAAFLWLHESGIGGTAVGVNNNTDFLRSVSSGTISVTVEPVHRGRRQQLWRVLMADDRGRLVATSQVRLQNIELPAGVEVPGMS